MSPVNTLQWYAQMGIDEVIEDTPINRFEAAKAAAVPTVTQANVMPKAKPQEQSYTQPAQPAAPPRALASPDSIKLATRQMAERCTTRQELEQAVRSFDGLAITKTATNTVFCDGNPNAKIMMIGEAPGAEEDAQGIPFCGASGKLLDQMLGHIGLDRPKNFYITNTLFWRPPGNRKPTPEEVAVCSPFVEKHVALMQPQLIILIGGTAVSALLDSKEGITKVRGKFGQYTNPYVTQSIPITAIFHPSYLLRSPGQKRLAWQDLLTIKQYIQEKGIPV